MLVNLRVASSNRKLLGWDKTCTMFRHCLWESGVNEEFDSLFLFTSLLQNVNQHELSLNIRSHMRTYCAQTDENVQFAQIWGLSITNFHQCGSNSKKIMFSFNRNITKCKCMFLYIIINSTLKSRITTAVNRSGH